MKPLDRLIQHWRIAKVKPYIPSGARVLDIGCGDGALFKQLGTRISEGIGIDPDLPTPVKHDGYSLIRGSFPADLPDDKPFDAITLLAVLEHIPPAEQLALAQACARYLRPEGRLILTVPSPLVDGILVVLRGLRLIDGMLLEQHYGFEAQTTPNLFRDTDLRLVVHQRFQLGLNHLFVFEKQRPVNSEVG